MVAFSDIEIFARVVTSGSMTAAGKELGLSPAVISKRIAKLEDGFSTRLFQRTTRQLSLTEAGQGFYERSVSILSAMDEAQAFLQRRAGEARGLLRVSAPTSFGRIHLAPHLAQFLQAHPDLSLHLELSDSFVDVVGAGFDVAIRIGELSDNSLVARKLAPNHRLLVASPAYLAGHGAPLSIAELQRHVLLSHNSDHWKLEGPEGMVQVRLKSPLTTNSSEVIREATLAGLGIALRSTWDVGPELKSGKLQAILPAYSASRRVAIHAVYPSRRFLAPKVRVFIDWLSALYGPVPDWDKGLSLAETPQNPA